jgi:hypothetical protein
MRLQVEVPPIAGNHFSQPVNRVHDTGPTGEIELVGRFDLEERLHFLHMMLGRGSQFSYAITVSLVPPRRISKRSFRGGQVKP